MVDDAKLFSDFGNNVQIVETKLLRDAVVDMLFEVELLTELLREEDTEIPVLLDEDNDSALMMRTRMRKLRCFVTATKILQYSGTLTNSASYF